MEIKHNANLSEEKKRRETKQRRVATTYYERMNKRTTNE